jgi:hypothetical protein
MERGSGGEVSWHKKFTVIAIWNSSFKLKASANYRHPATQLAQQLAVLPRKIEPTANICHLHLAVPPTGEIEWFASLH